MLKKILLALLVFIVVFVVIVALQPSEFSVTRSATIAAPPEVVFNQVNNFRNWEHWSPWAKLDPNSTAEFEGPESGKGAIFRWDGNDEVGQGSMTILESQPNELIRMELAFVKPMESSCTTLFTFKPEGEGTEMTWSMSGENNFVGKAMCLFMDMDTMVGSQFEQGLANIKGIVEKPPQS